MRKSKKGVTLVELIICCGIIVMIGGACTAVLMSGHKIFNDSASAAAAQLDTDVIQTYLTSVVPRTKELKYDVDVAIDPNAKVCGLYFVEEGEGESAKKVFTINLDGKETKFPSVADFEFQLEAAGDPLDAAVKPQFCYTVTMKGGVSYSSGFVLVNMNYVSSNSAMKNDVQSVNDGPLWITMQTPPSNGAPE